MNFLKKIFSRLLFASTLLVCIILGCKNTIEVEPPINEIIGQEIYGNNASASSVLAGIYADMAARSIYCGVESFDVLSSLSTDELVSIADNQSQYSVFYNNAVTVNDGAAFWASSYAFLFRINSAIEGCSSSLGLTKPFKDQVIAELKFLRAFVYFYLVNFYGPVPLVTTADIKINSNIERSGVVAVYNQIIQDLTDSQNKINSAYVGKDGIQATSERIRPNQSTVAALLARVYLYNSKWELAEVEASKVIQDQTYKLENLDRTFLADSKEAIWQLQPTVNGFNTLMANLYVLKAHNNAPAGPSSDSRPLYLSSELYDQFDAADNRKKVWCDTSIVINNAANTATTYPFPFKYKVWQVGQPRSEFNMIFRLAEQYLIRSEARAMQGKISGANSAESDLNMIRIRSGLESVHLTNQVNALDAILSERKFELFTEGSHRWLDLKRTGKINDFMYSVAAKKGQNVTWEPYKSLLPIPPTEFTRNSGLRGHQNPGYTNL